MAARVDRDDRHRRLRILFWILAIGVGLLHAWMYRHDIRDTDGISYLDMGDAYFRGDWDTALNGYWSPLYAWLLGMALRLLDPSPYWEYPVLQLVNFVVYLGALGCVDFFLRELILYHRARAAGPSGDGSVILPEWAWLALGYSLFLWASLQWVYLWLQGPDMCVAAFVFAAAGVLLRVRRGRRGGSRSGPWGSYLDSAIWRRRRCSHLPSCFSPWAC